jgi:hypothetical protein
MDWDLWRWMVDLAHEFSNLIKNMLQLTTNKKKSALHWKKVQRDFEQKHGRFKEFGAKAPWHISKERLFDLMWLCTKLRVCKDWVPITAMFEFEHRMKIADCLAFCGDRGAYFIGLMDIDVIYKKLFIQLVRTINVFLLKSPPKSELEKANIDLVMLRFVFFLPFTVLYYVFISSYVLPLYLTFYVTFCIFSTFYRFILRFCFILRFTVLSYVIVFIIPFTYS